MIHYKLKPPPGAKCTFKSMWQIKSSFPLHLQFLLCEITANMLSTLAEAECPPTPAEITGVAFPAHGESYNVEWDRKEEEKRRHYNSWWGAWCSPCSICTPPVSGQVGATSTPRYTNRQAATPGTTTQLGVPSQPACSQSLFFIFLWQHAGLLHS